jgi:hypothetical protein
VSHGERIDSQSGPAKPGLQDAVEIRAADVGIAVSRCISGLRFIDLRHLRHDQPPCPLHLRKDVKARGRRGGQECFDVGSQRVSEGTMFAKTGQLSQASLLKAEYGLEIQGSGVL